jgi:hypothetical protein
MSQGLSKRNSHSKETDCAVGFVKAEQDMLCVCRPAVRHSQAQFVNDQHKTIRNQSKCFDFISYLSESEKFFFLGLETRHEHAAARRGDRRWHWPYNDLFRRRRNRWQVIDRF